MAKNCQKPKLADPPCGRMKRIKLYLVDKPDTCYIFNIVPRRLRNWNEILKHITETLKPTFGAVLRLFALSSEKFVETFADLKLTETYVALGQYGTVNKVSGWYTLSNKTESIKAREKTQLYLGKADPKMKQFLVETKRRDLTVIYVLINGIIRQVPLKVVLTKEDLVSWNIIIRYLDKRLDIPEGISNITTIFGDLVLHPGELQHGFVYVAVPFLKAFVELDYLKCFKHLCSNYRGNYVLSIKPAPISTSETMKRKSVKSISSKSLRETSDTDQSDFEVTAEENDGLK